MDYDSESIKKAFYNLVSSSQPDWCSIMADAGEEITEITIELQCRVVFWQLLSLLHKEMQTGVTKLAVDIFAHLLDVK